MITKTNDLNQFCNRFEEIKQVQDNTLKAIRLSALTTDMENVYDIPRTGQLRIAAFKQAYPEVMSLYKEISQERVI
ncbi:hypothetical protein Pryu01_01259 [Paraliobacillus ryukyuensis]|uniref:Uncharacterized protein n=1 Tax=Paraliobacillus ryukyuensis TaxID=200904 RepID=A0A366EB09_9BACI|nr:hypothetical protein [Paraliobacillus ryukyuensis]RBO99507.1 hypothetical protein DES48_104183 [Paraliobacillus ryukyuensis]